jgi:hypothetical protein
MSLHIVVKPFAVYTATVGTAFPSLSSAPSGSWTLVGTDGELGQRDGLTITIDQKVEVFRGQSTQPLKTWRSEEDIKISFEVADYKLEAVARALGVSTTTGTNEISANLARGIAMNEVALLVRGTDTSPYSASGEVQYEFPRVVASGSVELKHSKNDVVFVKFEFTALRASDGSFGAIRMYQP